MQVLEHIDTLSVTDRSFSSDNAQEAKELAYDGLTTSQMMKHALKTGAKGFARLSKYSGNPEDTFNISGTPNLVLLNGREFAAQKLSDVTVSDGDTEMDYLDYKIRYFGYGSGGAVEGTGMSPNKIGPFDNDKGLLAPAHFNSGAVDIEKNYKYIHDGTLKLIRSDYGTIKIEKEEHKINIGNQSNSGTGTNDDSSVSIIEESYTAIKYTMFVDSSEFYFQKRDGAVSNKPFPFPFNEAALYAVATENQIINDTITEVPHGHDTLAKQNAHYIPFARFTTSTKWIEEGESLKIEWYILV